MYGRQSYHQYFGDIDTYNDYETRSLNHLDSQNEKTKVKDSASYTVGVGDEDWQHATSYCSKNIVIQV